MEDLISRQAAIDALFGICGIDYTVCVDAVVDMLENLPEAEPEERTAKVIKHDYVMHYVEEHYIHEKEGSEFLCGFCKKKVLDGDDYCSHCGTKLDWEEEIDVSEIY